MYNHITSSPININEALSASANEKAGALVVFSGLVRNHHNGKSVEFLEYDSHIEMAEISIQNIIAEANKIWELHFVFCQHRIGKVQIGESAVVVITSSSHRESAYQANRFIIDKVKGETPIWKKEYFSDGNNVWV